MLAECGSDCLDLCRLAVFNKDNRVGIAHRYRRELNWQVLTGYGHRGFVALGFFFSLQRQARGVEVGRAHIDRDKAVLTELQAKHAVHRFD